MKPNHPGWALRKWLAENNQTQSHVAASIGVAASIISDVCSEKRRVGAKLAVKLEQHTGLLASYLLMLQADVDIWKVRYGKDGENVVA